MTPPNLEQKLADNGQLIEAGWVALKALTLKGASELQINEMRKAFFAGAQHVFASIVTLLDEGEEPTADDMRRIEMIHVELEAWQDEIKRQVRGT